jgi:hypothetical protein
MRAVASRNVRWSFCLLAVLLMSLASGCGRGTGPSNTVEGEVTLDGKPLFYGTVNLIDSKNKTVASGEISEGKYTLTKVPEGTFKVVVDTAMLEKNLQSGGGPPPGMDLSHMTEAQKNQMKAGKAEVGEFQDFRKKFKAAPPKYGRAETTPLSYTVAAGKQSHDIEMSSK